jgi:hypothetical protein
MTDRPTGITSSLTLEAAIDETGTSASLTLNDGSVQLGRVVFETPEFATFLEQMAVIRAGMVEPVAKEIDVGARVEAVVNPKWSVKLPSTSVTPSVVLALRHPGFGWVANCSRRPRRHNWHLTY